VEPRSARALAEVRSLPGVMAVEPLRSVPARLRHGHRERQLAITGQLAGPDLNRVVDVSGQAIVLPPDGLVISKILGKVLDVQAGDRVIVEVLEGARPVREVVVSRLVDDYMGLAAYMEISALHRLMREGGSTSGAYLLVDSSRLDALYRRLKATPAIAGVALTAKALQSFRSQLGENFAIMTFINVLFAGIIAFGVVYNAARISLSERSRELASLRVLGFTIGEISLILLGELALITLAAIPPGLALGWVLAKLMVVAFETEIYRIPLVVTPQAAAWSALVTVAAAAFSGFAVRRKLDHLDLIAVLKTRE
jgi:putative ABC transport system permease protein